MTNDNFHRFLKQALKLFLVYKLHIKYYQLETYFEEYKIRFHKGNENSYKYNK